LLKIGEINVFYSDLQALWNVSFEVNEGEMVTLVGSNGAGKTTTLRTLSGMMHPRSGYIKFLDKNIEKLPSHEVAELGIAHIPEGRGLFSGMTILENLRMGAFSKRARKKVNETLEWVYELFPILGERKNQIAGTLSGGEQQMLAIARGLMSSPKLLMLDEPSLGLGPKLVLKVFETIKRINEEGVTVLLVEQNVRHVLELCSRGYVLEQGRITLEGKGENLLKDPYLKNKYLGM